MTASFSSETITFSSPILQGWTWPIARIVGAQPGPHLAIMAGVHVNETSSVEATIRLQRAFASALLRGRVSIIPVINLPALPVRSQYVCPIDGKNINFSFPGDSNGSYSEALAHAILHEWAHDADCLLDMHGGDLCENVSHFTICQTIGDPAFDQHNLDIARCFDAEIIVQLDPSHLEGPGRSCTGRAKMRRHAGFSEAGRIGLIEEDNVTFHYEGALRVAKLLGMIDEAPAQRRDPILATRYLWLKAPASGFYRYRVAAGQRVGKGTVLATAENTFGKRIGEVVAPEAGLVLWSLTHAFVQADSHIMGLAVS